ncbi:hypothetical protein HanRHA438_Chr16g0742871 [Helianthus annuus]|nr:hypothetical protein HanRHA438_Chr16g0742871 [Helianthus annuus]
MDLTCPLITATAAMSSSSLFSQAMINLSLPPEYRTFSLVLNANALIPDLCFFNVVIKECFSPFGDSDFLQIFIVLSVDPV